MIAPTRPCACLCMLAGLWLLWTPVVDAQESRLASFVGGDACTTCHSESAQGGSCLLEPIEAHARAYHALSRPEADDIAVLSGIIEPPVQSRYCLGCHATAADEGPRWQQASFQAAEGVQCEACHGGRSLHVEEMRSNNHLKVEAGGGIRRGDRAHCATCHVPRPSHDEVLRRGYRRDEADVRYKTPVDLVISPDGLSLFVVCERSNSVMVIDAASGQVTAEIPVGKRPFAAALSPDGGTLYVTNRLADSLSVIDTRSAQVRATIATGHEPHGVLTDASGRHIYVFNCGDDTVSVIDAAQLSEITRLAGGRGPWNAALSPDGDEIYLANSQPRLSGFRQPHASEVTVLTTARPAIARRLRVPDANMLHAIAFVPSERVALVTLLRTRNLVPITRLAQGWTVTFGLGVVRPDGHIDQVLLDEPDASFPDPMDIAVSPDGRCAVVVSGGADEIGVLDVGALLETIARADPTERRDVLPNDLSRSRTFLRRRVTVGRNPRSVVFSPDGRTVYVANALDDAIALLDAADFSVTRQIKLGGPAKISEWRRGEQLFHSAAMTSGRQFSCRTCHPEGHTNGLAFDIEADGVGLNPLQVRTLRGIFDTPPFKWAGTNPSLHAQCGPRLSVFFSRLAPLPPDDLNALVRYVSTIERPLNRHRRPDGLTDSQRRGKAVFERTMTNKGDPIAESHRCATCHNTPSYTARNRAAVGTTMWLDMTQGLDLIDPEDPVAFGHLGIVYYYDTGSEKKAFDAPHLNNIYDRAPFLHNGSANTLEEIWTRFNLYEDHGVTTDLTRRQFNDLIAYLKSL